jgi:streptogramin lyase
MTNRTADSLQILALVPVSKAPSNRAKSLPLLSATLIICAAALLPLAGCGVSTTVTSGAVSATTAITGRVHGGQQPVVGATVTLYAPGTTGYGSAPTAIVHTTTDSNGFFTLPQPYTCPANSPVTYLLATGGNPGAGNNSFLAEAALLPACSSLTASTYVYISEVTTVAAAYALAPFAALSAGTTNIGVSSTNLVGLTNALGPATNLANTATGQAVTSAPGMVLPYPEINTLADILAACVNTNTNGVPSTTCATLFAAATPPNGTAPTDTFQAAIDIALNPGNNAAALYALSSAIAPYQPTLPTPGPSDFAVGIQYNGGILNLSAGTSGVDIDASGNAWIATDIYFGSAANAPYGSINEISPAGVYLSGSNGYFYGDFGIPYGLSIDASGNIWIAEYYYGGVAVIPPSATNGSFSQPASLFGPDGIAVDNRNASSWMTNFGYENYGLANGTTVSHITSAGVDATGSPYGSQDAPVGVAIDNSGNIWVVNSDDFSSGNGFITKFTGSGTSYTPQTIPTGAGSNPFDIAIDGSGNAWVTDSIGVAQFNNSGTQLSPTGGYAQSLYTSPESIIVDGLGHVWVSNIATDASGNTLGVPGSVTAFASNGTLISTSTSTTSAGTLLGYTAAGTIPVGSFTPQGIKVDASGNLWITGYNLTSAVVTELIGIAAPVVTPLSVANSTQKLGTRP